MNDWEKSTLGEIVKNGNGILQTGPFGSQLHASDYVTKGIPCIMPANIQDTRINLTKIAFIADKDAQRLSKHITKIGDIIFSRRGDITLKALIRKGQEGFFCGTGCILVRPGTEISSEFLIYFLSTPSSVEWIMSKAVGATMPNINTKILSEYPLSFPRKDLQFKLAKVLSDLDSKIELNNRINTELESMAKLIYDYWFVQFDFPNENGKPYKSSGGKMVWSEELKREIPDGWNVETLSYWIEKDKSGDWGKESKEGNYTERVFCIRGADLNGLNGNGEVRSPERFILEKNCHKILDPHDLIVEISGGSPSQSTGRLAYITKDTLDRFNAPIICSNFCKAVTLKNQSYLFNFAFEWNKAYKQGVLFGYEGKTSGIKNLLFESFVSSYYTAIPPSELAMKFYDFMTPLESRKQKNLLENKLLAELRDWLLPMLMNGQVTASDVKSSAKTASLNADVEHYQQRKFLANYILSQSAIDLSLGKVKFEKLLHLSEYHIVKEQQHQQYRQHAAGPLDAAFTYRFFKEAASEGIISFKKQGALQQIVVNKKALAGIGTQFSEEIRSQIDALIQRFMGSNYEKPEIISTLYAVWNNRIIKNELITDELLKQDFLAWDPQKAKYKDQLDKNLAWMRKEGIVPDGWGEVID